VRRADGKPSRAIRGMMRGNGSLRSWPWSCVAVSVGCFLARHLGGASGSASNPREGTARKREVVVYYFHGTARCPTMPG